MERNEINEDVERELFAYIRMLEGENLKTKKYDDRKMVSKIMSYIKQVVDKQEGDSDEI